MKTIFLSLLMTLLPIFYIGCNIIPGNASENNLKGTWAFLLENGEYCETLIHDDYISFFSDDDGRSGPFPYMIVHDSIIYHGNRFQIKEINYSTYEWCNSEYCIFLEKLFLIDANSDSSKIDPFYLRRCDYLVKKGKITMEEALQYLCNIETDQSIEEEIINIK